MFTATKSRYLVPFDGTFKSSAMPTRAPQDAPGKKRLKQQLNSLIDEISELQRIFYAHDKRALLMVFQAMDAAGKDGTIRAVMSGVNPAGCQIFSFKSPSAD